MSLPYEDLEDFIKVSAYYTELWNKEQFSEHSAQAIDDIYLHNRSTRIPREREGYIKWGYKRLIKFHKVCGFFFQDSNERVCDAFRTELQDNLQGVAENTPYGTGHLLTQPQKKVIPVYTHITIESIIDTTTRIRLARKILNRPDGIINEGMVLEALKPLTIIFDHWFIGRNDDIQSSLPASVCKIERSNNPPYINIVALSK